MIRCLSDAVLVALEPQRSTLPSGLHVPEAERHSFRIGTVVAHGPGNHTKKGHRVPLDVSKGDRVVISSATYQTRAGEQLRDVVEGLEGGDHVLIRGADILGVVAQGVDVQ